MKKKQLVCSALAAAMMLSTAAPAAGAAQFSDSAGHWGESAIDRWSSSGVVSGIEGSFNPNGMITRGEMATILAEMLGLEDKAVNTYPDLNGGWYTDAMLKCAAAGIMTGDDYGRMRPYDNITGAEIAVILTKSLDLNSSGTSRVASATGYVKPWAQGYVDTLASRGIAVGNDGGIFEPMEDTSRAAVISMLDRAVDTYISSPGTYTASGLTIINTDGTVTLKGSPTSIDITAASTGARVRLDHTNVSGTIRMNAAKATLTADHATLSSDLQVIGASNSVSLEGTTSAGTIQLGSNAGSSTVTVGSSSRAGTIVSDAASGTLNISGEVNNIRLSEGATSTGVNVRSGSNIQSLTSNANNVTVSGSGTLRRADIYASNNRVTTPGTVVSNSVSTTPSTTRKNSSSSTRYGYYYRRPSSSDRFTVSFYINSGSKFDSKSVTSGSRVSDPGIPTLSNNIFEGWVYHRYYYYYDRDYYYYDVDYRYDWAHWYKSDDWKWDSSADAYYNSKIRVYYDDSRDYYFVYNRSTRTKLSDEEVRRRYVDYYGYDYVYTGYNYRYYDWDYWYKSSDWKWNSNRNAYYNSIADMYYDDAEGYYFTMNGSRRVRLSSSEVSDRYDRYYRGSYYYYDKRYPDRYWYDYREGDTFSFNDRIYGDVELYAKWTSCTDVRTESELINAITSGKSAIQIVSDITLNDASQLKLASSQRLHIKKGCTLTVNDANFKVSDVGGKVTGDGNIKGVNEGEIAGANFVKNVSFNGTAAKGAWSGSTFTVTFTENLDISSDPAQNDLRALAATLIAAIPEGATLTVDGHECASVQDVLNALGVGGYVALAEADVTTLSDVLSTVPMVLKSGTSTQSYTLKFVIPATPAEKPVESTATAESVQDIFTTILREKMDSAITGTATATQLKIALQTAVSTIKDAEIAVTVDGAAVTSVTEDLFSGKEKVVIVIGDKTYTFTIADTSAADTEQPGTDEEESGTNDVDLEDAEDNNTTEEEAESAEVIQAQKAFEDSLRGLKKATPEELSSAISAAEGYADVEVSSDRSSWQDGDIVTVTIGKNSYSIEIVIPQEPVIEEQPTDDQTDDQTDDEMNTSDTEEAKTDVEDSANDEDPAGDDTDSSDVENPANEDEDSTNEETSPSDGTDLSVADDSKEDESAVDKNNEPGSPDEEISPVVEEQEEESEEETDAEVDALETDSEENETPESAE